MMASIKPVLLFCGMLICISTIAQQKQHNKKQLKSKPPAVLKPAPEAHFNVAGFSEKRTLVQEKCRIPGTDSIKVEEYYVWLLPN
jgi:hypothetical protein